MRLKIMMIELTQTEIENAIKQFIEKRTNNTLAFPDSNVNLVQLWRKDGKPARGIVARIPMTIQESSEDTL